MRLVSLAAVLLVAPALAEPRRPPDLLREIEARFPAAKKWWGMVADLEWERDARGALSPRLGTLRSGFVLAEDPAGQKLGVRLPATATGPHEVWLDGARDLGVRTEELGIAAVPAEVLRGVVVYRGAVAGGDLLYKVTPTHVDEYLYLRAPPPLLRRVFEFDVGSGVGQVREAGRLIEVLATDGTARLRLSAPVARAANGVRRTGTVSLDGTTLIAELDLRGLEAPVLVDPDWTTTGTMTVAHWADYGWRRSDGTVMAVAGCALASCPLGLATSGCNQLLSNTDLWSPASGTWTAGPSLLAGRYSFAGVELANGELLVAGGCTATGCATVTAAAERWSTTAGAFVPAGTLPSARANMTGALVAGGDALVAGGCGPTACFADGARYSVTADAWTPVAPLSASRGYHTSTSLPDGTVLVIGGCADPACATVLSDAELYDPAANTWTSAGAMAAPRAGHTATLLDDGTVLVTGGCRTQPCKATTLATSELWQADARKVGTFTAGPPMNAPRHHHTATRLESGQVLLAGGADGTDATRTAAEIYLPVSRRFYQAPRMMMSRAYHVAVPYGTEGKVLVSGGCNPATCLPWAEVFNPAGLPVEGDGGVVVFDAGTEPPEPELDAGEPFVVSGGPHPKLFRTGVYACSTNTVQDLPCPVPGWPAQDGEYQPNTRPMVPVGDTDLRDEMTGLIWQAKDDGKTYTQAEGVAACAAYATATAPAGQWRLPTVVELMTTNHYGKIGPSLDQGFIDGQQTNYWTATPVAGSQRLAWTVKFDAGEVVPLLKDSGLPIRCVRGTSRATPPGGDHLRLAGPLTAVGEVVRDVANSLEWQRADDGVKRTWREALTYCSTLGLGDHTDWHLPNVYELLSLVEFNTTDRIKIDSAFMDPKGDLYWTGTFNEGIPTLSWSVTFNLGVVDGVTYSGHAYARCVRHLQPEPPPSPKPSSCGCGTGGGSLGLAALALLGLAARRRRLK